MPYSPTTLFRIAAMATILGGPLTYVNVAFADTPAGPQYAMDQASAATKTHKSSKKMLHEQKEMEQHVEKRIQTLHDKLDITATQEAKWSEVAKTMRDNEENISQLIKQRYENRKTMNAVDDLQSYAAISEAHTDGLKKMIAVFQPLYDEMSEGQKKDADEAFGRFEGHRDGKSSKKHG